MNYYIHTVLFLDVHKSVTDTDLVWPKLPLAFWFDLRYFVQVSEQTFHDVNQERISKVPIYRGKAKYLIGIVLSPVLADFHDFDLTFFLHNVFFVLLKMSKKCLLGGCTITYIKG